MFLKLILVCDSCVVCATAYLFALLHDCAGKKWSQMTLIHSYVCHSMGLLTFRISKVGSVENIAEVVDTKKQVDLAYIQLYNTLILQ